MKSFSIDGLRNQALRIFLVLLWAQIPVLGVACWLAGQPVFPPVGMTLAFAAFAQALARWDRKGDHARIVTGVSIMVSISILVGVMQGQKTQVDLHMYYFAALAVLVAACDWRIIVASAATVVIHHAILNFILPGLVYPGGADASRLALHTLILVMEAAVLVWTTSTIKSMFEAVTEERERVERAQHEADANYVKAVQSEQEVKTAYELNESERSRIAQEDAEVLRTLGVALTQLASGDLTYSIQGDLPAKAEPLRADFNNAVQSLASAMSSVAVTASGIRAAANNICNSSKDLSRRTEQQAGSFDETTGALLTLINASIGQTSQVANRAQSVVSTAKLDAEQSSEIVRAAIEAMNAIESSSRQMRQIIGVIDEIAFQTNLLALNAGVEAARAGDAGRGFAVVASEVRGLAQRSAESAKEIKSLISVSEAHVENGVSLVSQTGEALERIFTQVSEMTLVGSEIAVSVQQKAADLDQVNIAVHQMDQVTRQNTAMAVQSMAASQALSYEADELASLLSHFRIEQGKSEQKVVPIQLETRHPAQVNAPVTMLKTTGGNGGAVRQIEETAAEKSWEEF
jgi:methyl-accepting chemotaxis protein